MSTDLAIHTPVSGVDLAVAAAQVPAVASAPVAPAPAPVPAGVHARAGNLPALPADVPAIEEIDKPIFQSFYQALRGHGVKVFFDVVRWYTRWSKEEDARQARWDAADAREASDALRHEWGPNFDANLKSIDSYLDGLPPGMDHALLTATLPGGCRLVNSQVGCKWLLSLARPLPTGNGTTSRQAMEAEQAQLRALMAKPGSAYWKGPEAPIKQARYQQLLTALGKV